MAVLKTMGQNPQGKRLQVVEQSPNYRNNSFQNLSITNMMTSKRDTFKVFRKFMNKPKDTKPPCALPSVKTDLKNLPDGKPVLVWFGHSSYLIKINGKHILVDPVFSGYASPFKIRSAKNFAGSNVYCVDDMPPIDVLLITHDHYDHLDYTTLLKLQAKTKHIVTSLGVGAHFEYWGIPNTMVTELDWHQSTQLPGDIELTAEPARHFSGRSFTRSKTLWSSFVLKAPGYTLYLGADSGYDTHFKTIGQKHGPFDIAILECGQYNEMWHNIHMMPEETAQASIDLNAKTLLPVHWGKFSLSLHPWNEPIQRVTKRAAELNVPIATPLIGEPVTIGSTYPRPNGEAGQATHPWWNKVKELSTISL